MRTAQAGLEAAAVPTEACESKAARQAASTSQPGSPRSLLSPSAPFRGSLKPRVYPRSWGSESPLPTTHSSPAGSLFVWLPGRCGQCVSGVRTGWDKRSEGGRKGCSLHQPRRTARRIRGLRRLKRAAALGGAGSGPRSFTRVFTGSPATWTWRGGLMLRVSGSAPLLLRPQPAPANGVLRPAFRLLHSSGG